MSEVIDDKVDKFHETLISRLYNKKFLIAVAIVIVLFASWYVSATYEEFDWDNRVGELYLYRVIEAVTCPCGRREEYVDFFIGPLVPAPWPGSWPWPWTWNASVEGMTSWTAWTIEVGGLNFTHYREIAWLARAELFEVRHIKRLMGRDLSEEHVTYKLTIDYYPALLSYDLGINATHEEIVASDSNYEVWGGYLWPTAAQKFAEIYFHLKMKESERYAGRC